MDRSQLCQLTPNPGDPESGASIGKQLLLRLTPLLLAALVACAPQPSETAVETAPEAPTTGETEVAASTAPWPRLPAPPIPQDRPLRAGLVVVDGVYNTELVAPWDIFDHAAEPGIEVVAISPDGGPVTSYEGMVIQPHFGFDDAPELDVLVVPSAENSRGSDLEDRALIDFVRDRGQRAQFVMSLCWGAFVLAEAGLLDGHAATTFPPDVAALGERFPALDAREGYSFVHDRNAVTSHGGVKSFEAAMYLVDHLLGEEVATRIGGGLLIPWPPTADAVPALVVEPPSTD